jgi:hypothetical protein
MMDIHNALRFAIKGEHVILNAVSASLSVSGGSRGCAFGEEGFRMITNFIYRIPKSFMYRED